MVHKLSVIATILVLAIVAAPRARAQWVSTNGPPGNINSLAVVNNTLFAGSSAGVFFLNEGDTSWSSTGLTTNVQALLLSEGTLIAGTTNGVFFSNGLDTSWAQSDDSNVDFALAALGSNLFVGTDNGVFISNDNGNSWNPTNYEYNAFAFAVVGSNLFIGDDSGGVRVSPDNGNTWTPVDSGLPLNDVHAFAVSGNDLFAGTTFPPGGVYLTNNNGAIWKPANSGLPDTTIVNSLFVGGPYLFAGTDSDLFLSSNNGASWRDVSGAMNDSIYPSSISVYSFAVSGNTIFAGTQRGVWMSPVPFFAAVGTSAAPATFQLQCYPNPVSQSTTISFALPEASEATLTITDAAGRETPILHTQFLTAGQHEVSWDAAKIPSGVYLCRLSYSGQSATQRVVVMH
jgi:hypothetical protein